MIYINDTLYVVLDAEQARKGRVIYNRYKGLIEAEQVLLARIDTKDGEILALRRANENLLDANSASEALVRNREEIIILRDQEIKKLKTHRLALIGLVVLFIIV